MRSVSAKIIALVMALIMLCSLTACAQPVEDEKPSLEVYGMEVISMMEELVKSEFYGNAMSGNSEIHAAAQPAAAGSYEECTAIYKITVPSLQSQLELEGEDISTQGFSEELMRFLENRNVSALISQLNALSGAYAIAAASMYTASKTFVSDELTESMIYIYAFEEGVPAAITFLKGEDNTVSAGGQFLLLEDFPTDSAEAIRSFLLSAGFGCTVELYA
ncbi:MAG: hypothetical protein IJP37_03335 [Clostridia bacterium]|nr:hypothetical protein [Clostridia bacterium]